MSGASMNDSLRHLSVGDRAPVDQPIAGLEPSQTPLLEVRDICKRYESFLALDKMNFYIGRPTTSATTALENRRSSR